MRLIASTLSGTLASISTRSVGRPNMRLFSALIRTPGQRKAPSSSSVRLGSILWRM
jgi:hypothetical protein